MQDRFEYLANAEDWFWYKHRLDQELRRLHHHRHDPESYPCAVGSEWSINHEVREGVMYEHTFFYDNLDTMAVTAGEAYGH